MPIKHNKLDFTEFRRKGGHLSRPVYSRLFQIAPSQKPRQAKSNLWSAVPVVSGGIILILILQGLSYLSSAKSASTQVLGAATNAYTQLKDGSRDLASQNFAQAKGLFASAQNNIRLAQDKLGSFGALKLFAPQAQSADHMLAGAAALAEAGTKITQALALFDELKVSSAGIITDGINEKIAANRELLLAAKDLVDQAAREFQSVDAVPADYAETLSRGKEQVAQLSSLLAKLTGLEELYLGFFSATPHTYLTVFQNYDEARATGGFIGTYGVLKIAGGKINSLKISSVYDLDGKIFQNIAAPGPFQPAIKKWGMRDANWFADFPTSARKLLHFFELGGETADGVIAATPQLFSRLLKLTGPIEMSQYGVTLTSENFQQTVQFETSIDYDRTLNQPKKFLADFATVLLNRLTSLKQAQWLDLFQTLQDNLNQKQILLYSKESAVQATIESLGFSGKIAAADFDYLNVINTNLGGTKTDLSITQKVSMSTKILSDGSVLNALAISRDNQALENNRNFIRILVPQGSQMVSAGGFDSYEFYPSQSAGMQTDPDLVAWDRGKMNANVFIREESGKTEFSGWLNTRAGESRSVTLSYILPRRIQGSYSLLLQKQDGGRPYEFSASVDLGGRRVVWKSADTTGFVRKIEFASNSGVDDFWGAVFAP